jgi:heme-degrading monooxygenase HmoA
MIKHLILAFPLLITIPAIVRDHSTPHAETGLNNNPGEKDKYIAVRVIRYKLKADRVAENEQLIKKVFLQIHDKKLQGVRYAVYKLADGVSFMHIIFYETNEAHKAFTDLPAFKDFQAQARDRFEEAPITDEAEEIGRYSF